MEAPKQRHVSTLTLELLYFSTPPPDVVHASALEQLQNPNIASDGRQVRGASHQLGVPSQVRQVLVQRHSLLCRPSLQGPKQAPSGNTEVTCAEVLPSRLQQPAASSDVTQVITPVSAAQACRDVTQVTCYHEYKGSQHKQGHAIKRMWQGCFFLQEISHNGWRHDKAHSRLQTCFGGVQSTHWQDSLAHSSTSEPRTARTIQAATRKTAIVALATQPHTQPSKCHTAHHGNGQEL